MKKDPLLVRFARYYASVKHAGQEYSGGLPYTHHLKIVDDVVMEFWPRWDINDQPLNAQARLYTETDFWVRDIMQPYENSLLENLDSHWDYLTVMRAAAWLHDVIEDVPGVGRRHLDELFPPLVVELVWCVSNEAGVNRAARHALTYPKIRSRLLAVFLKLCDRIANVRQGGPYLAMYRKEYAAFKAELYITGFFEDMWAELDRLLA